MKKDNIILTEKKKIYMHYQPVKLIIMNILHVSKYYFLIEVK